jgi:hypothetical protein
MSTAQMHKVMQDRFNKKAGARSWEEIRNDINKMIEDRGIVTETTWQSAVSIRDQADPQVNDVDALMRRGKLKQSSRVADVIRLWWGELPKPSDQGRAINRAVYVHLCSKMYWVFVPAGTPEECAERVEADWEFDSKGKDYMDFEMFREAIFQMADIWCKTVQEKEYVGFLSKLFFDMKTTMRLMRLDYGKANTNQKPRYLGHLPEASRKEASQKLSIRHQSLSQGKDGSAQRSSLSKAGHGRRGHGSSDYGPGDGQGQGQGQGQGPGQGQGFGDEYNERTSRGQYRHYDGQAGHYDGHGRDAYGAAGIEAAAGGTGTEGGGGTGHGRNGQYYNGSHRKSSQDSDFGPNYGSDGLGQHRAGPQGSNYDESGEFVPHPPTYPKGPDASARHVRNGNGGHLSKSASRDSGLLDGSLNARMRTANLSDLDLASIDSEMEREMLKSRYHQNGHSPQDPSLANEMRKSTDGTASWHGKQGHGRGRGPQSMRGERGQYDGNTFADQDFDSRHLHPDGASPRSGMGRDGMGPGGVSSGRNGAGGAYGGDGHGGLAAGGAVHGGAGSALGGHGGMSAGNAPGETVPHERFRHIAFSKDSGRYGDGGSPRFHRTHPPPPPTKGAEPHWHVPKKTKLEVHERDVWEELADSDARMVAYKDLSNRQIYETECQRLKVKPQPSLVQCFSDEPGVRDLKVLQADNMKLDTILPLLDILRMNVNLERVSLKDDNLSPTSVQLVAHAVRRHSFLKALDVSCNGAQKGADEVGSALFSLVQDNRSIEKVSCNNLFLPVQVRNMIQEQVEWNLRYDAIPKDEFNELRALFKSIANTNPDYIDGADLAIYLLTHSVVPKQAPGDRMVNLPSLYTQAQAESRSQRRAQDLARSILREFDEDGDRKLTFKEFVRVFYPWITPPIINKIIPRYEDEEEGAEQVQTADPVPAASPHKSPPRPPVSLRSQGERDGTGAPEEAPPTRALNRWELALKSVRDGGLLSPRATAKDVCPRFTLPQLRMAQGHVAA